MLYKKLYCGADDSNHAGDSKGEFIVVTFSYLKEDAIPRYFKNKRDYSGTKEWLKNPLRDYRFTILLRERYRHSRNNLIDIAPLLIKEYLSKKERLEGISLYLDGEITNFYIEKIREIMKKMFLVNKAYVKGFSKKTLGEFHKRYFCPELVYRADVLANELYSYNGPIKEIFSHEKLIPLERLVEKIDTSN
ncbi:MAG: hypothetical protein QW273_00210 [Candidatus Pacearchaeota archaeon]